MLFLSSRYGYLCHRTQCLQFRHHILIYKCKCIRSIRRADRIRDTRHGIHVHLNDHRILCIIRQISFYLVKCCPQIKISIIDVFVIVILQKHHGYIFCRLGSDRTYSAQTSYLILNGTGNQIIYRLGIRTWINRIYDLHRHLHIRHQFQTESHQR